MKHDRTHSFTYDSLKLEGSLFVADLLDKAALGEADFQTGNDYHVPRGLRITEECGRSFQIASAVWKQFESARTRDDGKLPDRTAAFVVEFFRDVLGYAQLAECLPPLLQDHQYPIPFMAAPGIPLVVAPAGMALDTGDARFAVQGSGVHRKSAFQVMQEFLNAGACLWGLVANGDLIRLLRASPSLARPSWLEFDLGTILREARYPDFCAMWRILHASRAPGSALKSIPADAPSGAPEGGEGQCIWEKWRTQGAEQGVRVREGLRRGVTQALLDLGTGFLRYESPGNAALRYGLGAGTVTVDEYFREILRLVYRFLFVFTVEERGLIHATSSPPEDIKDSRDVSPPAADLLAFDAPDRLGAREIYARGYALSRLRDRALRHAGWNTHGDQWEGVKVLFRALATGEPRLDLPALGGLFASDQCPRLDASGLANRDLLSSMLNLRWAVSGNARTPVDYKNMGPEEMGSVYESLLELVPVVDLSTRSFGFIGVSEEGSSAGNARKTSGSYYTPDPLVQELIKSALDPVIEARLAAHPADAEKALLEITICDPSCGSGHFLLAAARRLAEHLAVLRSIDGSVLPADYRHALREVIGKCVYGVDLNPMAVELARTALWLEGYEPGRPLSFLDHHIRCGNSLIGLLDLDVLSSGIPDAAYSSLSGDDTTIARALKKRNADEIRAAAKGQALLFEAPLVHAEAAITQLRWKLESIGNDSVDSVERKREAFRSLSRSPEYTRIQRACDLWVSAFFVPKRASLPVPTTADVSRAASGYEESPYSRGVNTLALKTAETGRFFHWRLEFPEVFGRGGFDCVLGNPPWERIKLQEEEFFASRHPTIAQAKNKSERGKLIAGLEHGSAFDLALYAEFMTARRLAEAASVFAHVKTGEGGRYPLTGIGDVNTYALFAETFLHLFANSGRAGFIVPSGIATDDSTKAFFAEVATKGRLVSLFDFENRAGIFPDVDSRVKFCLLTLGRSSTASFSFFLTDTSQMADMRRRFSLSPIDFELLNPNTRTCPVFRSAMDAEITRKIYSRVPVLIREGSTQGEPDINPWSISFSRMLDMSNDSGLFRDSPSSDRLPLYEAKMIHQFDHRWATYDSGLQSAGLAGDSEVSSRNCSLSEKTDPSYSVRPRYWVDRREVLARIAKAPRLVVTSWLAGDESTLRHVLESCVDDPELSTLARCTDLMPKVEELLERRSPKWLMGWRDICRSTDERTVIASVVARVGVNHKLPIIRFLKNIGLSQIGCFLGNINGLLLDFVARQKVGGTSLTYHYIKQLPILPPSAYAPSDLAFILPRVLELTYTAHDMEPWASDIWDSLDATGRKSLLRARDEASCAYKAVESAKIGSAIDHPPYSEPSSPVVAAPFSACVLPPFPFLPSRRAILRAELDARYARLYGLTRDELRYILDPADVMGPDYPSETFRVLKSNELRDYGEYRTRRLVLEAWDAQA